MKRNFAIVLFITALSFGSAYGQEEDEAAERIKTREQVAQLLEKYGDAIHVSFRQSEKQPFNYVGSLKTGLTNTESLEIVISVTAKDTIGFRVYPHYNKGYINVDKVSDRAALMRLLLRLSDRAFLFWGTDESGDVFTGYTFTLESGFPEEAMKIVLRSIVNSDRFVGEMRPILDAPIEPIPAVPPVAPPVKAPPAKAKVPVRGRRRG
jgi:hypothetical protein